MTMILMHSTSPARRLPRLAAGLSAALCLPVLAGCGTGAGASDDGRPQVVASIFPLQFLAERVAGDRAAVTVLTSPGTEPHDLELSVRQTAVISESDVVATVGGLQPAVDEAVEQASPDHVVDATERVEMLEAGAGDDHAHGDEDGEHGDEHADEHGEEDEHGDHGDLDPHFWTDPARMATVAAALAEALTEADPAGEATYASNLAALEEDLAALDEEIAAGLEDCERDTVVVSHDAFAYFGDRYGLDLHAINGLSPDAEPSPAHLRELAGLIEAEGITTVFSERLATAALADTLAGELDLRTAVLDPLEGLTEETSDEDYLSLMLANLEALREANGCR